MLTPRITKFSVVCFSLVLLTALTYAQAPAPTFTTVDISGAMETAVNDINTAGTILVGYDCKNDLCDAPHVGIAQAWVMINGTVKMLKPPGSTQARAYGVNDHNQVVGWYIDASSVTHGFMFSGGTYTTIDPPGATLTNAWSINNAGEIVGAYTDSSGVFHGFIDNAGTFTTFNAPNGAILTELTGINTTNQMVGIYDDSASTEHGFTLVGTHFTDVTFPGTGIAVTATDRINDSGEIVGLESTSVSGPFKGYSRKGTKYTTILFPASTETRCRGLNNAGEVVGKYTDAAGLIHGFTVVP
jgi:probable HAF family extracellular repeat protein